MSRTDFVYIDQGGELDSLCKQLDGAAWLAIDTEFERENTYFPELCLLQIATRQVVAIIDPLSLATLAPLFELLYNTSITKVFHSARQDLEIFFHLRGRVPIPLFDTQLAAGKLGFDNGIGYANLVEKMLGIILDKSHTRTNWKRRPLKPEQLRYAADDVIYLGQMYEQMAGKLADRDRSVLQVEFAKLNDPQLYLPAPELMWQKINESRKLNGPALAALQKLAAWREITARIENLPRKWVLADQVLVDIARRLPLDAQELTEIKGLDAQLIQRYGAALLAVVSGG